MVFTAEAVDCGLDCRIEQFHDQNEQAGKYQGQEFDETVRKPGGNWQQNGNQCQLLAKRRLMAPGVDEALFAINKRSQDSDYSGISGFGHVPFLRLLQTAVYGNCFTWLNVVVTSVPRGEEKARIGVVAAYRGKQ